MNTFRLPGALGAAILALLALAPGCTSDRISPGQCEFDRDCSGAQLCVDHYCRNPCATDADCPNGRCVATDTPNGRACRPNATGATSCARDSDCERGLACFDGRCLAQCRQDYDCRVTNPDSSCVSGRCVAACPAQRGDCDGDASNGCETDLRTAVPHCGACNRACPATSNGSPRCDNGACAVACNAAFGNCDQAPANGCEAPLMTDRGNCGACGRACPEGMVCSGGACGVGCTAPGELRCGDRCVAAQTDAMNCGACGNVCPAGAHAAPACAAGRCGLTCDRGFADCDMNPANGCEADLSTAESCGMCGRRCAAPTPRCVASDGSFTCSAEACPFMTCAGACVDAQTDVANCGACGNRCPAGPGSEARCEGGRCLLRCTDPMRTADCDGLAPTGCESVLPTDPANCGACGTRCAGGANASASCAAGACGLTCNASFGNCDGMAANGCETDTRADVTHCGRCGNACSAPSNATATCAAGACGFACAAGYADCDRDAADGCEVNTAADRANCGACGNACPAGQVCSAGRCTTVCGAGEMNCGGSCANLASSTSHCGMCNRACASPPNATPRCVEGGCSFTCAANFGDCDRNAANGCETSLLTSATSCGSCGTACSLANATAACNAGACVIASCNAGFFDCDGAAANGCEVDGRSDRANCGACRRACALANATAACTAGACAVASCNAGYADCDRAAANGCEVDTRTSTAHCGGCGNACSAVGGAPSCAAGACGIACAAGRGNCDMNVANGCEVATDADPRNCGACGRACAPANATPACAMSACGYGSCNAGFADCDGAAANGCEVDARTSVAHCGACGRACSPANATASCAAGVCGYTACNAGFADCDGNRANGCEVNLNADPRNCGRCGNACNATGGAATCAAGVCGITCAAGRGDCNASAADGCEVDTTASASNCGRCGNACAPANATPACAMSTCGYGACNAGFADCDANRANGCEVNTQTSSSNCGACGRACPSGQVCSAGACTLVCGTGLTNCAGVCVNTQTDPANCGRCANACATPANASRTCAAGACGFACSAGFADCNASAADGCEANTQTSTAHCGGCGRACTPANATASCAAGACGYTACNAGFADCDGDRANGCEVDVRTSVPNCGACGRACSPANATAACSAGACGYTACNAGFADCDGNRANGCEVNLNADPSNCGRCGNACAPANATAACSAGACGYTACNAGFGDCDGVRANGCEVDTQSTVAHCGGCGRACSATNGTPACAGGNCSITCSFTGTATVDPPGFLYRTRWGDCDGDARTNGCETSLLTTSACHACGRACSFPNAAPTCSPQSATQCAIASCNAGFADCNAVQSDGCEVDTANDNLNCGACGARCLRSTCRQSACRPTNDACSGATPINLAGGRQLWLSGNTTNALHDIDPSCRATTSPDLFYSFTLTQRELVYADTFGNTSVPVPAPSYDTVLFFANSCTTSLPAAAPTGMSYCNDDASSYGGECAGEGNRSQVMAVLDPGTYYLVLSGYGGQSGTASINFQHLPVGNLPAVYAGEMGIGSSYTFRGATSGTGVVAPSVCTANGPEVTFWWRHCSSFTRYNLAASTCNAGSNYDTVVYYRNATGSADLCSDDLPASSCPTSTLLSSVYTLVTSGGGPGIHAVTVDGYGAGSVGNYVLTLYGSAVIAGLDFERGVCRPRGPRLPPPPRRLRAARDPRGAAAL
ncbi:MAG: hypothetical protein U0324_10515 [Polyangiales bacterium]